MPKAPREMYSAVRANLPKRTGVTLNEWKLLLRISGPRGARKDQIEWLKRTYGLGTVQASVVVAAYESAYVEADPLSDSFSGRKKALLPIADKVINAAQSLGVDVRVEPSEKEVPVIRRHPFALVKATSDRLDLGLALPGTKATERLMPVRKSSAGMTHHVSLRNSEEVDAEVLGWLRRAYELDVKI